MVEEGNISYRGEYPTSGDPDNTVTRICSWVLYAVVCQMINVFGIVTNIINIICFVKLGFKDSINVSLLGLSVSDLGSLITMSWTCLSLSFTAFAMDLPYENVDVIYMTAGIPHFAFIRVSSCITAMIALERCLSIVAPLKVKYVITPTRAAVIITCIFLIFTFSSSPIYVVNKLGKTFSIVKNKSIVGIIATEDKEQVEMYTFAVNNFFIPFCTFVIVAVCTIILSNELRHQTEWRKQTLSSAQADKISTRNLKVAKMVVTISTLFIVCFVPFPIIMLAVAFEPELSIHGKYVHESILMCGFTYVIESVNSSMNIFIYKNMSFKYRETLRKLFSLQK